MKTTRKTEIVVESSRILTIRSFNGARFARCEACGRHVQMLNADEAAILGRLSSRTIYLMIEAGELHFKETREGLLFICSASLEMAAKKNASRLATIVEQQR